MNQQNNQEKAIEKLLKKLSNEDLIDQYFGLNNDSTDAHKYVENELQSRKIPVSILDSLLERKAQLSDNALDKGRDENFLIILLHLLISIKYFFWGIIAGYIYYSSIHTRSDGKEFKVFSAKTRKAGVFLMIAPIFVLLIVMFLFSPWG